MNIKQFCVIHKTNFPILKANFDYVFIRGIATRSMDIKLNNLLHTSLELMHFRFPVPYFPLQYEVHNI